MSRIDDLNGALDDSGLNRPRGLWERLVYPLARAAFVEGFEAGYAARNGELDRVAAERDWWKRAFQALDTERWPKTD